MQNQTNTLLSAGWIVIDTVWRRGFLVYRITAYGNQTFYGQWLIETVDNSTLNDHDKNWVRNYFGYDSL